MGDPDLQAQIAAATACEDFFVPALFQDRAPRFVDVARIEIGHRVLDVACGTGVLARAAAARVAPAGSVAGLDWNPGMLAVAARLAPEIAWRQGTAESLPYPDGSFDAVVSQFGLMFFEDRRLALREMRRVLVPGGRLAVAVWDFLDHTPAYAAEVALLQRLGGQPAADALKAPFVLGDRKELAALFAGAGVPPLATTTHRGRARFPSIRAMLEADLRGWLPLLGVALTEDQIARILAEAERALSAYVTPDGTVVFDSPAHIVTASAAWRPAMPRPSRQTIGYSGRRWRAIAGPDLEAGFMHRPIVARAFVVFHVTLGTVVLLQSLQSAFGAAGIGSPASPSWHVVALAGVEALAALLFLFRPTLRVGGAVLMLTFAVAAAAHALRGEVPGALLVYAAGTAFVMVHGPVSRPGGLEARGAA